MDPEEDLPRSNNYRDASAACEEPRPSSPGSHTMIFSSLPQSIMIVHDTDGDDDVEIDGGSSDMVSAASSSLATKNYISNTNTNSSLVMSGRNSSNKWVGVSSSSYHRSVASATQQQKQQHRQSTTKQHKSYAPRELALPNSSRRAAAARARRSGVGGGAEKQEYYSYSDGGGGGGGGDDEWEQRERGQDVRVRSSNKNRNRTSRKPKQQHQHDNDFDYDDSDLQIDDKDHNKIMFLAIEEGDGRKHDPKQRRRHEQQHQQRGGKGDDGQRHRRRQKDHSDIKDIADDDSGKYGDEEEDEEMEESENEVTVERERTNSPELNIHRRAVEPSSSAIPPVPSHPSPPLRHSSSSSRHATDPNEEDNKSYFSRLDAPPTPTGPELNTFRRGEYANLPLPPVAPESAASTSKSAKVGGYSNYMLDEEGIRQYQQQLGKVGGGDIRSKHPQTTTTAKRESGQDCATDNMISQLNIKDGSPSSRTNLRRDRKADPPASGRGCDPTPSTTPVIYRRRSSVEEDEGGVGGGDGGKQRKDVKKDGSSSSKKGKSQPTSSSMTKPRKPIQVKSILKKRDAPIPITQFGKPVVAKNGDDDEEGDAEDDGSDGDASSSKSESGASMASDPDVIEQKQRAPSSTETAKNKVQSSSNNATSVNNKDDDSKCSTINTKSGLRKGKYAALNDRLAASKEQDDDDDHSNNDDEADVSGHDRVDKSGIKDAIIPSDSDGDSADDASNEETSFDSPSQRYDRTKSHYLRTADLGMTQDTIFPEQFMEDFTAKPEPHYHHPSPHPPPGVTFHIDENWICLDDGKTGSHSPIAPQAVDALVDMGYRAAANPMMWTPSAKTRKYMTDKGLRFDDIPIPGPLDEGDGIPGDTSSILVWSGKFPHKYHGHDVPAIRSQGVINMSPEALVDLLMDSNRVSEYNKSNIGRDDEVVLCDGTNLDCSPFSGQRKKKVTGVVMRGAKVVDGNAVFDSETDDEQSDQEEGGDEAIDDTGSKSVRTMLSSVSRRERRQSRFVGVTKLVRTKNKPPLVRKVLEFTTLLHCRALTDDQGGDGYIIVARAVTPASDADASKKGVVHCEILLNVHIIRRLRIDTKKSSSRSEKRKGGQSKNVATSGKKAGKGDLANRCLMINVNHMKSPLVPSMVAKTVGLSAAINFISDIRALT